MEGERIYLLPLLFVLAVILLLVSVSEDGLEISIIKIPPLKATARYLSGNLGFVLLGLGVALALGIVGPLPPPTEPTDTTLALGETATNTSTVILSTEPPTATPTTDLLSPTPTPTATASIESMPTLPPPGPNDLLTTVLVPLSGPQADRGRAILQSIQLAVGDYADRLAARGISVKILPVDDQSNADLFTPQGDPVQALYYIRQASLPATEVTWAENPVLERIAVAPPLP